MNPDLRQPVEYATKADVLHLHKIVDGTLRELRQEIRADLAEQISGLKTTIITTLIAQTAIFGTLVTVLKLFAR